MLTIFQSIKIQEESYDLLLAVVVAEGLVTTPFVKTGLVSVSPSSNMR